uniref:Transporter n=1 Tax=Sinocyclocheilus grahami TaxID=75366 RepID=A0A672Q210_SINGR
MPKNSKTLKREIDDDEVTESVKDLLSNEDNCEDSFKKSSLMVGDVPQNKERDVEEGSEEEEEEEEEERPAWSSKLQYILAQVGFSVGLGNVWRFPYLCQKNGGGAYLLPYLILLVLIGIPLFFLELAVGQRIRRGSIGVWNYISPRLGGIGFASCLVNISAFMRTNIISSALYKNGQSRKLLDGVAHTFDYVEPECEKSSATTYYWYRVALDISDSISESGGLNWRMTLCLLAAWTMVCLAMMKGIQSSGKGVTFLCILFTYFYSVYVKRKHTIFQ